MSSLRVLALGRSSLKVLSMSLTLTRFSLTRLFRFFLSQNNDCHFSPAQAAFCISKGFSLHSESQNEWGSQLTMVDVDFAPVKICTRQPLIGAAPHSILAFNL